MIFQAFAQELHGQAIEIALLAEEEELGKALRLRRKPQQVQHLTLMPQLERLVLQCLELDGYIFLGAGMETPVYLTKAACTQFLLDLNLAIVQGRRHFGFARGRRHTLQRTRAKASIAQLVN